MWSFYTKQPIIRVFVEQAAGSNFVHDVLVVTQTNVIFIDPISGNILRIEPYNKSGMSHETHDFMLVEGQLVSGGIDAHQIVLAVPNSGESGQAFIIPSSEASLSTIAKAKPLYYTQIDLKKRRITGHLVDNASLKTHQVWNINLGENKEILSVKTQYNQ